MLFLDLRGNAPLSPNQQTQLLQGVTRTYYNQRGSVTAALHAAVEKLNHYLLDRNLRSASSGLQTTGLLAIIAARGERVYLGQVGPIHAFVVNNSESQHLHDTHIAGRGLGTSRKTTIRFSQVDMVLGGLVLLSPAPPPTWSAATLREGHKMRIERLHQMLIDKAGPDLTAVVLKVQPGSGELSLLQPSSTRPRRPVPGDGPPPPAAAQEPPVLAGPTDLVPQAEPVPYLVPETADEIPEALPVPFDGPPAAADPLAERANPTGIGANSGQALAAATTPVRVQPQTGATPGRARHARPAQKKPAKPRPRPFAAFGPVLLRISEAFGRAWQSTLIGLRAVLGRMTPGEGLFTLPPSVMAGIAISVPLVVVTIATVVYFQRGLAAQHQDYLNQAGQVALQAADLGEPADLRVAWQRTLDLLDTAESYSLSEESRTLRIQAQRALDELDGVVRLQFASALTSRLSADVQITRLAATNEDLYMLNDATGSVLRAWLTGRGFELDPTFQCGPGGYGSLIVGPLIDIATLPKGNEFNATVLAMDTNGNLIYCIPGKSPISAPLVPPDSNWGAPRALTLDSNNLYILDPQTNAVWIYGGANGSFGNRPSLFFSDQIPPMLDVIDLAVNRQDLYLVHADGHLTTCTYSTVTASPTRCEEPAVFNDTRAGREAGAFIPDTQFTQIRFTPPPDPSIYLLDPENRAIYHFSLRLTLQRQFRALETAQDPLPKEAATAFAVNANRTAFLAVGNQVFYTALP